METLFTKKVSNVYAFVMFLKDVLFLETLHKCENLFLELFGV